MTNLNTFTSKSCKLDHPLPLTLMRLNDWSFITASGTDAKKYLQGQLTANIVELSPRKHIFTAHCNAQGKVWSTLRIFHYKEGFGYIARASVVKQQLRELKKYAIFSKITLNHKPDIILLGVSNSSARDILNRHCTRLPDPRNPIIHLKEATILHFSVPLERFLIITDSVNAAEFIKYFPRYGGSQQWLALDIASGFANIDIETSKIFIPQAVNLQYLPDSISFQKGCYIGQEIIARAKYRGANKRAMFWLMGTANILPKIGDAIECKVGANWRRTGTILASVKLTDIKISIQIVMCNDIPHESVFRLIGDDKSQLKIQRLLY